jgi:hypothetical protein
MNGFSAEGIVSDFGDLRTFETKDSMTLPSGNNVNRPTEVAITAGIASKYADTPVATNSITEK